MFVKVVTNMSAYNMLHDFAGDAGQWDRVVILGKVSVTLFKDRSDKGLGQSMGTSPDSIDWVYMAASTGASSMDNSWRMRQEILSGPDAFFTFRFNNNFWTPSIDIVRGLIGGYAGPYKWGISECLSCGGVNTDLNCSFRIVAFDLASECKLPPDLRAATSIVSWCLDFTYRQNGFESLDWNPSRRILLTYFQWARLRALLVSFFNYL